MENQDSPLIHIPKASFEKRKKIFQGREQELGIQGGKYRGTSDQNIYLDKLLIENPKLREQYLAILSGTKRDLSRLRGDIIADNREKRPPRAQVILEESELKPRIRRRKQETVKRAREALASEPETNTSIEDRLTRGLQATEYSIKAKKLGEYVNNVSVPDTGKNSCGAAVGALLNNFGFRHYLPQSGRDGKNWDTILDGLVRQGLFKKVPCSHPKNGRAGGVLVYNGGSPYGSEANRKHGHVEIISSKGQYVSYYKGDQPGGSARRAPDAKSMGFCGYVYYPV